MFRNSYPASPISMCKFALRRCNVRRRLLPCLALFSLSVATAFSANGQTFENLISFNGTNGAYPRGPLIQGTDGRIYGTTVEGGDYHDPEGDGSVFKMTPSGALTTLIAFCPQQPCVSTARTLAPA